MRVALDIDNLPAIKNGRSNQAVFLPVINASKQKAEIIFHTYSIANLANTALIKHLLNLVPGKATVFFGRPEADIYLGA